MSHSRHFHVCIAFLFLLLTASHIQSLPSQSQLDTFNDFITSCHTTYAPKDSSYPSNPSLKVALAPGMGLGTFATRRIEREQVYMYMPWQCVMSVEGLLQENSAFSEALANAFGFRQQQQQRRPDDFHVILFYLLREKQRGKASRFHAYIDVLPRDFDTPYYWTEEDRNEFLQGSEMLETVQNEFAQLRSKYAYVQRELLQKYPQVFQPEVAYSFKEYEWATHILNSRTIWVVNGNGVRSLVPLLDAINCKELSDPNRLHTSTRDLTSNAVVTRSPDHFEEGEQVFENYGSDNHNNFFSHGFTLPNNSHDCVKVRVAYEGSDPLVIDNFRKARLPVNSVHCVRRGRIPQQAMAALQMLAQSTGRSSPQEMLHDIIEEKVASYPSTLAEDRQALVSKHILRWQKRLALEFVSEEKRLLHELMDDLRPHLPQWRRRQHTEL